eukprot:15444248-Alexandrium_andersonii.AAC.1
MNLRRCPEPLGAETGARRFRPRRARARSFRAQAGRTSSSGGAVGTPPEVHNRFRQPRPAK